MALGNKLDDFETLSFLRQFRVLLTGGKTSAEAIRLIEESMAESHLKRCLNSVYEKLNNGAGLGEAIIGKAYPFPESMTRCLKAMPVVDHDLPSTLMSLEAIYETRLKSPYIASRFFTASGLMIPFVIFGAIILFFLIYIGPLFESMFSSFGKALPALTQFVLNLSGIVTSYWWLAIVSVPLLLYFTYIFTSRYLLREAGLYYFFSLLLGQIRSGAGIERALSFVAESVESSFLEKKIRQVAAGLQNGETLSDSFRNVPYFTKFVADTLKGGEEQGELDTVISSLTEFFSGRQQISREKIIPFVIIGIGVCICIIITAMYLPIFGMASLD